MKHTYLRYLLIASTLVFGNSAFAETDSSAICEMHQTPLSIFAKNDMVFQYNECHDNGTDENYVLEFLQRNSEKNFLSKQTYDMGYDSSHVKAVSIFQPKISTKPPVLIVLHGMESCCYPRPDGTFHTVKLFQIMGNQSNLKTKDITSILGENKEGFEGQTSDLEKSHYSLKTISAIKQWLTKHY